MKSRPAARPLAAALALALAPVAPALAMQFELNNGIKINVDTTQGVVRLRGEVLYPYYGCDRTAVVQLEYQAGFPFARRVSEARSPSAARSCRGARPGP